MTLAKEIRRVAPEVRGCTRTAITYWERGDTGRSPSDVQLAAWAQALGLELTLIERAAA